MSVRVLPTTPGEFLFVCTYECKATPGPVLYLMHGIRVKDLIPGSKSDDLELINFGSIESKVFPGCGKYGGVIFLSGGVEPSTPTKPGIYTSSGLGEASTENFMFSTFSRKFWSKVGIPPQFNKGKAAPNLFEVRGSLYALAGIPWGIEPPAFEKYTFGDETWNPLPDPPYLQSYCNTNNGPYCTNYTSLSCALVGTKIMVSTEKSPVFCFDVAQASSPPKWTMAYDTPFPFIGRALVLDLEDFPYKYPYKLVFGYEYTHGVGSDVVAYLMSNNDSLMDRIQALDLLEKYEDFGFGGRDAAVSFAHLGGPRVCFTISNFCGRFEGSRDPYAEMVKEEMRLLVVSFEFSFYEDIHHDPILSIKPLASQIFQFRWPSESIRTIAAQLLGCFVV